MSNHFFMGAINKETNKYEYPRIANKINNYKCPFCEKNVIFKHGKIKQPHFCHYKSDNPCSYYDKPNETQIHKDAKLLMKTLLDDKRNITVYRICNCCYETYEYVLNIKNEDYIDNFHSKIEYKFIHNDSRKSADVALLKNGELKYIFEICYKNKTREENRPEPWFEIKAEILINDINTRNNVNENDTIELECIRDYKCIDCNNKEEYNKKMYFEYVKKLELKRIEEISEENELLLMSKEDIRTLEIQIKKENEYKKLKTERELEYKKLQDEIKKLKEDDKLKLEKEKKEREENEKKIIELNKTCSVCNINYCKCKVPDIIKDQYDRPKCNKCYKRICKCIKITDFFKNKK